MQTRDTEFLLSQYLDGTLSPAEAAEVERALAADSELRQTLADYQKLNGALLGMPLPEVRWDALADRIASQINASVEAPAESYPMPWLAAIRRYFTLRSTIRYAAAAMILVVALIGWREYASRQARPPQAQPAFAKFVGPEAEIASGPSELSVEIGGPAALADKDSSWQTSPVVATSTTLVIAAGGSADQDMLGFSH